MKNKAVIAVVAVLLLVSMTQVSLASTVEDRGARFKEACLELWANLSPEQREQAEEAREQFRADNEALREEFRARKAALREEYLNKLPEEARAHLEAKMEARAQRHNNRRSGNRAGTGCISSEI